MKTIATFAAAVAIAASFVTSSDAQHLTILGQGENFAVEYAPGYSGNVVGGGHVRVFRNGENLEVQHHDDRFAMRSPGIPFFTGGSEGSIVYLPPHSSSLTANR